MSDSPHVPSRPRIRLLQFSSGGWVILLLLLFTAVLIVWQLDFAFSHKRPIGPGDGKNPATYGFDLSNLKVPGDFLVASRLPRDAIEALVNPPSMPANAIGPGASRDLRKFLVESDRVIGVSIGGESRAYPLRMMNWHEIVNDTLGGRPIAVAYSPFCDSVAVFDREWSGRTLEFSGSGLLYNSNLLFYDRPPHGGADKESLWSQLLGRAVAGPAAETSATLKILPCALVGWGDWTEQHPETTVLRPADYYLRRYKTDAYGSYFERGQPRFPAAPLPVDSKLKPMDRVVHLAIDGESRTYSLSFIAKQCAAAGWWKTPLGGATLNFYHHKETGTASVFASPSDAKLETLYSLWFAWNATHPGEGVDLSEEDWRSHDLANLIRQEDAPSVPTDAIEAQFLIQIERGSSDWEKAFLLRRLAYMFQGIERRNLEKSQIYFNRLIAVRDSLEVDRALEAYVGLGEALRLQNENSSEDSGPLLKSLLMAYFEALAYASSRGVGFAPKTPPTYTDDLLVGGGVMPRRGEEERYRRDAEEHDRRLQERRDIESYNSAIRHVNYILNVLRDRFRFRPEVSPSQALQWAEGVIHDREMLDRVRAAIMGAGIAKDEGG